MGCSSKKSEFLYEHLAFDALVYSRAVSNNGGAVNYYKCKECDCYHLTSQGDLHQDLCLPEIKDRIKKERVAQKYS